MTSALSATAPRPLARGALLQLAVRVVTLLAGFAVSVLVARLLGPAGAGRFAIAGALLMLLGTAATLGIEGGLAWLVGGGRWAVRSALATSQLAALALGLAAAALGALAYLALPASVFAGLDLRALAPALLAVPLVLAWTFSAQVALAADRYEAAAAIAVVQGLAYVGAVGGLAAVWDVEGAVGGLLVANAAAAVGGWAWIARAPQGSGALDMRRLRKATSFGVRLWAANVLAVLVYRADLFLLSAVDSDAAVGRYAVAIALIQVVSLSPRAVAAVLLPRVARLVAAGDSRGVAALERRTLGHTTVVVVLAAAALAAVTPLIGTAYGSGFRDAAVPVLLLLPGAVALGYAGVIYAILAGRGRPERSLHVAVAITPLALALYAVLVPTLGAAGAALGSSLAYATSALLAVRFLRIETGGPVLPLLRPGAAQLADYRALLRRGGATG